MKSLTKTEAGARIGVSEKTIQRLVHAGKLRAIMVGGRMKIFETDLDEYLRGAQIPVAPATTTVEARA